MKTLLLKSVVVFFLVFCGGVPQYGSFSAPFYYSEQEYSVDYRLDVSELHFEMVYVYGGSFIMGCTREQDDQCYTDEHPAHKVTLGDYYMGKYPVTQAQWRAVMGSNPSYFRGCDRCPVERVSWNQVQNFIKRLNEKTGKWYRLPTEAEWEFAARSGIKGNMFRYSGNNNINDVAWYSGNSDRKTHPVGIKGGNDLGIHDMTGNVWEWCSDWFGSYCSDDKQSPAGPARGTERVLRGGSWLNKPDRCRVSYRAGICPDRYYRSVGFRLAHPAENTPDE